MTGTVTGVLGIKTGSNPITTSVIQHKQRKCGADPEGEANLGM